MADSKARSQKCAQTQSHPQSSAEVKPPGPEGSPRPDEAERLKEQAAMARLAEAGARILQRLNHPHARNSSSPKSPAGSRVSTVAQAKNYLRARKTRSPKFLGSVPNLERHSRKCVICHHPEREMIEELFIHWHSPHDIAGELGDRDNVNWVSIYRHVYALGLDAVRRRNFNYFFENLLDDARDFTPTMAGVIAAARAFGCVTEDGRWVEPPKRVIVTTITRKEDPAATTSTDPDECGQMSPVGADCQRPITAASAQLLSSQELDPALLASSFAGAALNDSARSALCGSGLKPRHNAGPACASSLPEAAFETPAAASPTPPSGQREDARRNKYVAASATALPGAAANEPAAASRPPSPGAHGTVRSGTREIRLPLNSHKTKDK